jgi:hypothetical protein
MRINEIKREAHRLKRTVEKQPRLWRFRGRRVVNADEWNYGDWSKLPDEYCIIIDAKSAPADYYRDYLALMKEPEDPLYGSLRCSQNCAIYHAQQAKKEINSDDQHWQGQGGEGAKEKFYQEVSKANATVFGRQDAMRQVRWRIFNELAEASNRACEVINYFRCPYGDEWRRVQRDGYDAHLLWEHIKWYNRHWNLDTSCMPLESELKWYHFNEPSIIDVTSYDDIIRSIDDGRLDRIIDEHTRYMRETGCGIWNL